MATKAIENDSGRSLREIVQKKILDDVVGVSGEKWKVLVLDEKSTRVISSVLTMFDIMERRVTIVENLHKNRQPFPDMDVIYFITPNSASLNALLNDFKESSKPKYGVVHIIFTDSISQAVIDQIQSNNHLVNRIETFKEMYLDYLVAESNVFAFDMPESLSKLYGSLPDPSLPATLAKKLANLCITLNEHPNIRYQASSNFTKEIAVLLNTNLINYRKANPTFWVNGDDVHHDRERGQILILDRSFDVLSPLMHEYTYQAMVHDLLQVSDGVISYKTTTNKNETIEKQALLNENDEIWSELRHNHIAKVIETIKTRMNDIIQNNAGASLAKGSGANLSMSAMAAAVKQLPEYQQTMTRLGEHVAIASQCMDVFSKLGLLQLSQVEQTVSTGVDEDNKEVKGKQLLQLVLESLSSNSLTKSQKIRLLIIFFISQRAATPDERRQLIQAAELTGSEQQILINFEKLIAPHLASLSAASASSTAAAKSSFFSIFRKTAVIHNPTPEGEYTDTRHIPQLRVLLEQLLQVELPLDKFPSLGPSMPSKDSKSSAKSVRKYGNNARYTNKNDIQYDSGRCMVFIAGGISYAETRAGYELMNQYKKEVITGSTNLMSPNEYMDLVNFLDSNVSVSSGKVESL